MADNGLTEIRWIFGVVKIGKRVVHLARATPGAAAGRVDGAPSCNHPKPRCKGPFGVVGRKRPMDGDENILNHVIQQTGRHNLPPRSDRGKRQPCPQTCL
jgi:hypothetical protein